MSLSISSMQMSTLDHFEDVAPISDSDENCLAEIQKVLKKHGALSRFGINLMHTHFEIADDEIMMETTDMESREHVVRPVKKEWLKEQGIEAATTVIGFDERGYRGVCGCDPRASGHHHK